MIEPGSIPRGVHSDDARSSVPIIDAQVHVWLPSSEERPWSTETGSLPHGSGSYFVEELLSEMDEAGVAGCVLVPPSFEGDRNDYVTSCAAAHPRRFQAQGRFDVSGPASGPRILEAMANRELLGLRLTFNRSAAHWLADGVVDWLWPVASDNDIPISLYPWDSLAVRDSGELQCVADIAAAHPDCRISLDHYGVGQWVDDATMAAELEPVLRLAELANVSVKVSALPTIVGEAAKEPGRIAQLLRPLFDAFGPDRLYWGSDRTRSQLTYVEEIAAFTQGLELLGSPGTDSVMGRSVKKWLGWRDDDAQHEVTG